MNQSQISECLLAGLVDLENSGDLVITHNSSRSLAEKLCSLLINQWSAEFLDEPPYEVVIENCIHSCTSILHRNFSIEEVDARSAISTFLREIGARRTLRDLCELVSHQGDIEISDATYYCICLGNGSDSYYSDGYLAWRRKRNLNARH
ncbi:hypothetical protein [Delftia acidovorans]|jgi:hypothetical protein